MIKKLSLIVFLLTVSYLLLPAPHTFAQPATESPQAVRDRLNTLKEERQRVMKETREEGKNRMETFRAQIKAIRDERKQMLTDRISDKTASSNARLTDRMGKALGHLREILNRVKARSVDFKAQGKDTTALDAAVISAESAIAAAQSAVDAQREKEYTANITDELTLRNTIGQMVSQFRQDIRAVHKLVVDARQAVMKAIMEAAKLRGENNTE
jgi:hypothetical protein